MCLVCHRIGAEGGQVGPNLTHVGGRFGNRELLESILYPSAVMDPKYQPTQFTLTNGEVVSGTTAGVNAQTLKIETNPFTHDTVTIQRSDIKTSQVSSISPMPPGLINTLSKKDILDLLAYLKHGRHLP
jgi:putative heme-binding domain-containing protein